ncbi:hypothetical protein M569_04982, partial [Genlisea aurea]
FFFLLVREILHTKSRKEDTYDHIRAVLGDAMISCEIEKADPEIASCSQGPSFLSDEITEEMFNEPPRGDNASTFRCPCITMDNSLSPSHTLVQIACQDHKGLIYDVMRTLKDYNIQVSYGRCTKKGDKEWEMELFIMQGDGKKLIDSSKQSSLRSRLQMELSRPLRVTSISRGPDTQLLVANPVELSGRGRPNVFHDITLAVKTLNRAIFSAEIWRYMIGGREWEVYRVLLGEGDGSSNSAVSKKKMEETVWRMLMSWE